MLSSRPASRSAVRPLNGRRGWRTPKAGCFFGWLTFWYLAIAVVAMDNALASQALMPVAGMAPDEGAARLITVAVLLVQAVLVIASTRLLGMNSSSAVTVELTILVVLLIGLGAVMFFTGSGTVDNLTSRGITADAPNYFAVGGHDVRDHHGAHDAGRLRLRSESR